MAVNASRQWRLDHDGRKGIPAAAGSSHDSGGRASNHSPEPLSTPRRRRATVCPTCAEIYRADIYRADIYRADTYQLVLAGLRGGKGVPDTVARQPCVFVTFIAPSFGPVHSRRERGGRVLPCRPRRNCPHGVDLACNRRT
jgi:hypothetical protein